MNSYWDFLSPDLQSYILQLSKMDIIFFKKKEFIHYLNDKLIQSYKFNICYGLFFIRSSKLEFSIYHVEYHIKLIIEKLLINKIYSMNQLIYLTEYDLKNMFINPKYYNVISFWRYHYFMKYYKSYIPLNKLEVKWLQKINILKSH